MLSTRNIVIALGAIALQNRLGGGFSGLQEIESTGRTEPRPTCHTTARASQANPLTGRSKTERRDRPSAISRRLCDGRQFQR